MGVAIVFILLSLLIWGVEKIKDFSIEEHNKRINEFEDHDLYRSAAGTIRDKKTGEARIIARINGDLMTTDGINHVYKNVSQEKRNEDYLAKKANHNTGETTYMINPHQFDYERKLSGEQFKDYQTGDVYVMRSLVDKETYRKIRYYVDIDSMDLIRPIEAFQDRLEDIRYRRLDASFRERWPAYKTENLEHIQMCTELRL